MSSAGRPPAVARESALRAAEVSDVGQLDSAFGSLVDQSVAGILVLGSAYAWVHREHVAALAARQRVPAVYSNRDSVLAGGLMSYGPVLADQYLRAAAIIDRILKGARPSDVPVEQPTRFEFVLNRRAAKALGVTIPPSLLQRADEWVG